MNAVIRPWHCLTHDELFQRLDAKPRGLAQQEVEDRLKRYGNNTLPRTRSSSLIQVVIRQFASPFIYILLLAALVSFFLQEFTDAGFIAAVLLVNAVIGCTQEYKAERSAAALQGLLKVRALVERDGETFEIDAEDLVPGDLVYLESGNRVPADMRLLSARELSIDESLLTGESVPVAKTVEALTIPELVLADRSNMTFAGTVVSRGRGKGLVVHTAQHTQLGRIAKDILTHRGSPPPLIARMARFTRTITYFVGVAAVLLSLIGFFRGAAPIDIFLFAVALLVSAIPEGLPVALTIALSVASSRMSRRHVIVRKLVAVEGLGSCTMIATDKTGTLTCNEMTVQRVALPTSPLFHISGEGYIPDGTVTNAEASPLRELAIAVAANNEASLFRRDSEWHHHGDPTDVALLVFSHKVGITRATIEERFRTVDVIPFESERRYAAIQVENNETHSIFVKGALENLLPLCSNMLTPEGEVPLDAGAIEAQANELAAAGYRVLAVAKKIIQNCDHDTLAESDLCEMVFLGCVGMKDPLRPGVVDAVTHCHDAGIHVVMITGDHPLTALSIARELNMAHNESDVITGQELAQAADDASLIQLIQDKTVFARIEPHQKLAIVRALQQTGHFVAVTGDGANDAPALKEAQIGVAMGQTGTDVAREAADLVITDDNFASIVNGVEEGRVAYDNVRKVINLLISTGAGEIVLVTLAVLFGSPLPLLPAQLLWLNLVTNGIQDVALAFEPNEGDALQRAPRPPTEPIFNRIMIERTLVAALVMGSVAYTAFTFLLHTGYDVPSARNFTLLLMVLFENVHIGNCRSETKSAFVLSPFRNLLLLGGTLAAQGIHILSLYIPLSQKILAVQPVSLREWTSAFGLALLLVLVVELHKRWKGS